MELSSSTVSFLILLSCVFWSSLYGLFCLVCPQRSYEWNCRVVTMIHAVAIVVLSYIFGIYYNPWPFTHPGGKSSVHEVYTMVLCLGYFLFDFCWCLWFYDQDAAVMLAHHLITIVGIIAALTTGRSGTEVGATIFGAELSNPLLQLRWFMRENGWKKTFLYEVNDLLFMLTFAVCRIGIGSYFMYCEWMHPLPSLFFKVGAVALYVVSWLLMFNIMVFAYRKYTKMYKQWGVKEIHQGSTQVSGGTVNAGEISNAKMSADHKDLRMRNGRVY